MRRVWGARPVGKLEGALRNSPGKTHGHRAPASAVCARRYLGQPPDGGTVCMLEGREQTPAGMSSSAGPGAASLRDCPQGLLCGCPVGRWAGLEALQREGALQARASREVPSAQPGPCLLRRGGAPAPGRSGSSCLPLPPLSALAECPTESQNHRMFRIGRDLWGSSIPTPLPKQGHLQQAAQDLVQVGLEYLQRRRLHNLPEQPVTVLHHPQREEVLPHVQTELPVLPFVSVAPCPVSGHH